jgi:general secretion pathway protein F
MVAAGEATGGLTDAFARLSDMAIRQQRVRKTVISAMLYPSILIFMCANVIGVLVGFVVPRFHDLFVNLRAELPFTTRLMFSISNWAGAYWPVILGAIVALGAALWWAARRPESRRKFDELLLRLPVVGRIVGRLMVARVLRVWAAMLRSHVPLLETIRQSQTAVTSPILLEALGAIENSVAGGGRVGRTLAHTRLVEPVIASAITTGEENGRLSESVDFVAAWLDDDNAQLISTVTRIIEPALLAVMGLIVGAVAMSLFLPLFDLATAGGG